MKVQTAICNFNVRTFDHALSELRPEWHSNAHVGDSMDLASAARTKEAGRWRLSEKPIGETLSSEVLNSLLHSSTEPGVAERVRASLSSSSALIHRVVSQAKRRSSTNSEPVEYCYARFDRVAYERSFSPISFGSAHLALKRESRSSKIFDCSLRSARSRFSNTNPDQSCGD
ncbi:hypothetical protein Syun_029450 [Stephania yunnanensis]|uniref:Uncharacterized protein n=1 Tax=Stephania yunnanensis TaxID=152371 RepID=A0AAP0E5M6_9MAGN